MPFPCCAREVYLVPQFGQLAEGIALFSRRAADFLGDDGGAHAAPALGVKTVPYGHVIINDNALDVYTAGARQVCGQFKVHDVAGVVLYDEKHTLPGIYAEGGFQDGVRGREANTAPGQAASSIPRPTNPPCMGSCPLPPPDNRATLFCTGASAR